MHLLVSEQYIDSIMHGATMKLVFLFDSGLSVAAEFLGTFRFAKLIAETEGN